MGIRNISEEIQSVFDLMQEGFKDCDEIKKKQLATIKHLNKIVSTEDLDIEDTEKIINSINSSHKNLLSVVDKKIKLIEIHSKIIQKSLSNEVNPLNGNDFDLKLSNEDLLNIKNQVIDNDGYNLEQI